MEATFLLLVDKHIYRHTLSVNHIRILKALNYKYFLKYL